MGNVEVRLSVLPYLKNQKFFVTSFLLGFGRLQNHVLEKFWLGALLLQVLNLRTSFSLIQKGKKLTL
jgi:hypothetical protein